MEDEEGKGSEEGGVVAVKENDGDQEEEEAPDSEADSYEKKYYQFDQNIPDISDGDDVIVAVEDKEGEDATDPTKMKGYRDETTKDNRGIKRK